MLKVRSLILLLNKRLDGQALKCLTTFSKGILFSLLLCMLSGCGSKAVNETPVIDTVLGGVPYDEFDKATGDYQVPEIYPSCIVDINGYNCQEDKKVIFTGENIPDVFNLVNSNGDIVFTGNIEKINNSSYGDFSIVTEEGQYYIEAEGIGQSYRFIIGEDVYSGKIEEITNSFNNYKWDDSYSPKGADVSGGYNTANIDSPEKLVIDGSKSVINLIVASELRNERLDINAVYNIINYECQWLIKMQDESGGVSTGYSSGYIGEITTEATAYFGTALGAFSGIYREYDSEMADRYLYQAEAAYEYLRKIKGEDSSLVDDSLWFMINSALFRTTGKTSYKNEIASYYDKAEFYGSYFLLTTPKIADPDICFSLMDKIISKASDISNASNSNEYYISNEKLLYEDMIIIAFANSTITNREYRRVLQNGIHYLDGRNEFSKIIDADTIYEKSMRLILYSNADLELEK